MTITYTPKNNKKEIKVEGYGEFTIRPYGAGEELQVRANMRELNEIQTEAEALLAKYKDKDKTTIPEEDKKILSKLTARTEELVVDTQEILKGTVTSKTEGAVDKLFKELDRAEIRNIIDTALMSPGKQETMETTDGNA